MTKTEFGRQEYQTDAEIRQFAEKQDFPGTLMKLGNILGDDAPVVWKFFKESTGAKDPTWNFKGKCVSFKNNLPEQRQA